MIDTALGKLKFPIGPFKWMDYLNPKKIESYIEELKLIHTALEKAIQVYKPKDF